jgi:hypothetical protein
MVNGQVTKRASIVSTLLFEHLGLNIPLAVGVCDLEFETPSGINFLSL